MKYLAPIAFVLAAAHDASAFQTPHPHVVGPRRHDSSPSITTAEPPTSLLGNSFIRHNSRIITSPTDASSTALFGIPKMFRWLTDQYPNILNRRLGSAQSIPPIDNFYLDMNGIIHPCTHGNNEDEITLLDETEMFKKIFGYVDRLYKIVQPKKVLYLAVDGVSQCICIDRNIRIVSVVHHLTIIDKLHLRWHHAPK